MPSNIAHLNSPPTPADLPVNYPHGGGVEAAARSWQCDISEVLDLSTGLHPAGPPEWVSEWVRQHASLIAHYPDRYGEPARAALAEEFSVKAENILMTAGAQAGIEVVFQAMGWSSMAIQIPCYNEPIRCARRAGCDVRTFEEGEPPAADLLWLTSPSNPSGQSTWPCPDHPRLTPRNICLDESYMPFSQRRALGLVANTIRIGSLTKTFCIPGLRLGYVIADIESIGKLNDWLPPWPTSTLALHLLPGLLPEADVRDEAAKSACKRLVGLLEFHDWQCHQSHASFVTARPQGVLPDFATARILVRTFPEWPQLAGWVRFGFPGDQAGWQRLEDTLCRQP